MITIYHRKTKAAIGTSDQQTERNAVVHLVNRGVSLAGASLRGADLQGLYLQNADLRGADLRGADFSCATLTGADLRGANLRGANLKFCELQYAKLDGAIGLPKIRVPKLHQAINTAVGRIGCNLNMGSWHCGTQHCRAGWAITLAGPAGKRLEKKLGACTAGAIIYHNSTGMIPNFYAENDEALKDIRRCERLAKRAA